MIKDVRGYRRRKNNDKLPNELLCGTALENAQAQLAAIVVGSLDAILTKDLDGIITSWNQGAEKIFGYTAEEAIGEPVTLLIPPDRQEEEPRILARIRRGERVEHFETIRRRKDGRDIHISLTVSPLKDRHGNVVGASKIARDITDRVLAQNQQTLLLQEMQHRIKNVFAVADSLIGVCAARTETSAELATMVRGRLQALARAHSLTVPLSEGADVNALGGTTLKALIATLVEASVGDRPQDIELIGDDLSLLPTCVTPMALVLNELVTNATKYGAWCEEGGRILIECARAHGRVVITWTEYCFRTRPAGTVSPGFGTRLSDATVSAQLGGTIERKWEEHGLCVTLRLDPASIDRASSS